MKSLDELQRWLTLYLWLDDDNLPVVQKINNTIYIYCTNFTTRRNSLSFNYTIILLPNYKIVGVRNIAMIAAFVKDNFGTKMPLFILLVTKFLEPVNSNFYTIDLRLTDEQKLEYTMEYFS